ncbi:hypothetical protein MJ524_05890 [Escherichia coli]|nr:hypothetical protein MJ524_05890 [Escherichia coli]
MMPGKEKFPDYPHHAGPFLQAQALSFFHRYQRRRAGDGADRGNYERVMPLDILPTILLRDLLAKETPTALRRWAVWSWVEKIWRCAPMFALESMNMARRCAAC